MKFRPSRPTIGYATIAALMTATVALLLVALLDRPEPPSGPVAATPTTTPTAPPATASPVEAEFGRLAGIPADQARVGAAFARAWCSDVRFYKEVLGHEELFLLFPGLRDFEPEKVMVAAVHIYCPEYTDQIRYITGERTNR